MQTTMKNRKFLLLAVASLMMAHCSSPDRTDRKTTGILHHSGDYRAAVFNGPDRRAAVLDARAEIEKAYGDYMNSNHVPGLVYGVVVDSELVCFGGMGELNIGSGVRPDKESMFRIASMTKSFTAMAVLKLRDEGQLSISEPAAKYIPEMADLVYPTEDSPPITLQNLMHMRAGFPEDNPWGDRQLDANPAELTGMVEEGLSFSNAPATAFEYSNLGYALLGEIISRVSDQPFQDYITENILLPLGMEHTVWEYSDVEEEKLAMGYRWEDGQWIPEPMLHDGSFGAMGGLITSIDDFSKYVSFLLSAWPPRNGRDSGPVKRSTLREMQISIDPTLYPDATGPDKKPCPIQYGYGYGLSIVKRCTGETWVMHSGGLPGFGSHYMMMPDYGIGIMAFCNRTYASPAAIDYTRVKPLIFEGNGLEPRELPASDILKERKEQLSRLITAWDTVLGNQILAENFFLDRSREDWIQEVSDLLENAGPIVGIGDLTPENQLRGTFLLHGRRGDLSVFFTLTPERVPKVQELQLQFMPAFPGLNL